MLVNSSINISLFTFGLIMAALIIISNILPMSSAAISGQPLDKTRTTYMNETLAPVYNVTISSPPRYSPEEEHKKQSFLEEKLKEMNERPPQLYPKEFDKASRYLGPQTEVVIDNETTAKNLTATNNITANTKNQNSASGVKVDPPLTIFKMVGGDSIRVEPNYLHTEPAVASSAATSIYVGNFFVLRSTDGGTNWVSRDYNEEFMCNIHHPNASCDGNNTGDNDVIYSPLIQKFLWYRQGVDGTFSLGISPDTSTWNFVRVEANNFREGQACQPPLTVAEHLQGWNPLLAPACDEFNLNRILMEANLKAELLNHSRPNDVNFWWDFPQLALSNRYLYISTDIMLGCGTTGLDWAFEQTLSPRCAPGQSLWYGSMILRAKLDDLNHPERIHLDQGYFKRSENHYYDSSVANLGLTQGAGDTMYWASHVKGGERNQLRICSWNDFSPVASCAGDEHIREIPPYRVSGGMNCPSPGNINWCSGPNGSNWITGGWVRGSEIGFLWDVNKDPACMPTDNMCYPYPWVDAAAFRATDLTYLASPAMSSRSQAIQYGFASPNDGGLAVMAWYGSPTQSPAVIALIKDNLSPNIWDAHGDLGYSSLSGNSALAPGANLRWGDYLRIRPYGGSGHLWEGSAYVLSGAYANPSVNMVYVVFGRETYRQEYENLSNVPPNCMSVHPNRATLWPPNHQMTTITIMGVSDLNHDPVTIHIIGIHQDEPTRANPGDQAPDGTGIGRPIAQVRAERAGPGDGRVYHVSFTANDERGGTCNGEVLVSVPHDQAHRAIDSGASFDSTRR
jgi:hypothetical protein